MRGDFQTLSDGDFLRGLIGPQEYLWVYSQPIAEFAKGGNIWDSAALHSQQSGRRDADRCRRFTHLRYTTAFSDEYAETFQRLFRQPFTSLPHSKTQLS